MPKIDIGGTEYDTFASVAQADTYFAADISNTTWTDADATTKGKALVTATRWLMSACWNDPQPNPDAPVEPFITACIELAGALVTDPTIYGIYTGATKAEADTKRMKAGSVEIEYFAKFDTFESSGSAGPFPGNVMNLVGSLLCSSGSGGIGGASTFGTCYPSEFDNIDKFGYFGAI